MFVDFVVWLPIDLFQAKVAMLPFVQKFWFLTSFYWLFNTDYSADFGTKAHILPAWRDYTVSYQFSLGKGKGFRLDLRMAMGCSIFRCFRSFLFVFPPSSPPTLFVVEFQEANQECKTIVAHSCSEYFVTALMEKISLVLKMFNWRAALR